MVIQACQGRSNPKPPGLRRATGWLQPGECVWEPIAAGMGEFALNKARQQVHVSLLMLAGTELDDCKRAGACVSAGASQQAIDWQVVWGIDAIEVNIMPAKTPVS